MALDWKPYIKESEEVDRDTKEPEENPGQDVGLAASPPVLSNTSRPQWIRDSSWPKRGCRIVNTSRHNRPITDINSTCINAFKNAFTKAWIMVGLEPVHRTYLSELQEAYIIMEFEVDPELITALSSPGDFTSVRAIFDIHDACGTLPMRGSLTVNFSDREDVTVQSGWYDPGGIEHDCENQVCPSRQM